MQPFLQEKLFDRRMSHGDKPSPWLAGWQSFNDLCMKNNSITSDFWIISGVVLQIFCIFLVSLSTFYYLCGINTFIYVRENIKIAGN